MTKKYEVWITTNGEYVDAEDAGKISTYNIVDTTSKNEQVVVFHVNTWVKGVGKLKQDEAKQRLRAYALCDYMNRMEDYINNFDGKVE